MRIKVLPFFYVLIFNTHDHVDLRIISLYYNMHTAGSYQSSWNSFHSNLNGLILSNKDTFQRRWTAPDLFSEDFCPSLCCSHGTVRPADMLALAKKRSSVEELKTLVMTCSSNWCQMYTQLYSWTQTKSSQPPTHFCWLYTPIKAYCMPIQHDENGKDKIISVFTEKPRDSAGFRSDRTVCEPRAPQTLALCYKLGLYIWPFIKQQISLGLVFNCVIITLSMASS